MIPAVSAVRLGDVVVTVSSDGLLFFNEGKGGFEYPAGAETHLIKASGLWMAGRNIENELHGAISKYRENGKTDFINEPGWNKIWRISRDELEAHQLDFIEDGVVDFKQQSIYSWPGRANPHSLYYNGFDIPNEDLAPFWDENGDSIYNPDQGDYPILEFNYSAEIPDEHLWFRYSDNVPHSESDFEILNMEVHTSIFVLNKEDIKLGANNIVVRHILKYKGQAALYPFYVGVFSDLNIGCSEDDYIGTSSDLQTMYAYNSDDIDDNCVDDLSYGDGPPVIATKFLRGPLSPKLFNGETPNFGELPDTLVETSIYTMFPFKYGFSFDGEPNNKQDYFNYLSARWKDGSSFSGSNFFYDGIPGVDSNTEIALMNSPGNRRGLSVFCPIILHPGALSEIILTYNVFDKPGNTNLKNVQFMLSELSNQVGNTFSSGCSDLVSVQNVESRSVSIFPNPASVFLQVKSESTIEKYELINELGQTVRYSDELSNEITIKTNDQESGIYFLKIYHKEYITIKKLIIQN